MKNTKSILLIVSATLFLFSSCKSSEQDEKVKTAFEDKVFEQNEDIAISWGVIENYYESKFEFKSILTITNNGNTPLPKEKWNIYFSFCPGRQLVRLEKGLGLLKLKQISGDFFKLSPDVDFKTLKKGESVSVEIIGTDWAISEADAPNGFYIVWENNEGEEKEPITLSNYNIMPFTSEKQTNRFDGDLKIVPTATTVFEKYKKTKVLEKSNISPITPSPINYSQNESTFILSSKTPIFYSADLKNEANYIKEKLDILLKGNIVVNEGNNTDVAKGISLKIGTVNDFKSGDEAYTLSIDESSIHITGTDAQGVFYGIQSLRALLPLKAYQKVPSTEIELTGTEIKDAPRFKYRGMHLDVGRNFQEKEVIIKLLDLMSFYKLNKFHFHFTDDEGWRIEIPGLPELTEVGSRRGHDLSETNNIMPSYGSGANPSFKASHGSGFYSKDDYLEILKYATQRHIEIIPEVDVPGHARAAILAMKSRYKRLSAEGKQEAAEEYLLNDPKDSSDYLSVQRYKDNIMCVCQNSTFNFLEKVISEIDKMHKEAGAPLNAIHIGGDEVPAGVWENSPACSDMIATNSKGISTKNHLTNLFFKKINTILKKHDLITAGWEEIGLHEHHKEDGTISKTINPEFVSSNFRPYVWNNVWGWGSESVGYQLANAGYPVVLSNATNLYFDLAYEKDPKEPGFYWAGFVNAEQPYEFVPMDLYKSAKIDRMGKTIDQSAYKNEVRLTEEGKKNILGIQGQLWSETVKGGKMMEYFMFPKMISLAERAWSKDPQWATVEYKPRRDAMYNESWNSFANSLGQIEFPRLDYINNGVYYRIPLVGAHIENNQLTALTKYPGFTIRYTVDGSTPTIESDSIETTIALEPGTTYTFAAFNSKGRSGRTTVLTAE